MDIAAMDVHLPLPRALLWQWHFLHFWDSLLFNGEPNALTEGRWSRMRSRLEAAGKWPNPAGLELHVAFGDENNMKVSEIWASREQFQAFGEGLMPILTDVGIEFSGEPEVFEVHNLAK